MHEAQWCGNKAEPFGNTLLDIGSCGVASSAGTTIESCVILIHPTMICMFYKTLNLHSKPPSMNHDRDRLVVTALSATPLQHHGLLSVQSAAL
jgi:hypothetical protein